jgi:hypothetical protein
MLQKAETETRSFYPNVASDRQKFCVFGYCNILTGSIGVHPISGANHD